MERGPARKRTTVGVDAHATRAPCVLNGWVVDGAMVWVVKRWGWVVQRWEWVVQRRQWVVGGAEVAMKR